jgi:hypothetical protein|tara:strand:- start:4120 stop:5025 length:906 start_codon:yes stop_codon:yes gene_type:complete
MLENRKSVDYTNDCGRWITNRVTARRILLDPREAGDILALNTANFRNLSKPRVSILRGTMANGDFVFNGDAIRVSKSGILIDGQTRLSACVESGVAIDTMVITGLDEEVGVTIDRGSKRTLANYLHYAGVLDASTSATSARLIIGYDKGMWNNSSFNLFQNKIYDQEIINFAIENKDELSFCCNLGNRTKYIIAKSIVTALGFIVRRQGGSDEDLEWFIEKMYSGVDLSIDEPVYWLKKMLDDAHAKSPKTKMSSYAKRMLLTVAWNKHVLGEEATKGSMSLRISGIRKRKMPNEIFTENS